MDTPGTPAPLRYTHGEFVAAYRSGAISVNFDPRAAARFLSGRLLLPLFMLPVLGIGVALALTGWIWSGLTVIALGIIMPRLIKRGAPHFLLQQALDNEDFYRDVMRAGVMHVVPRAGG
ncbi:MAG: hypothetical protein AB7E73_07140 [Burkholderiales bacterium]